MATTTTTANVETRDGTRETRAGAQDADASRAPGTCSFILLSKLY